VSINLSKSELCKQCGKCCQCMVIPMVIPPLHKAVVEEWLDARGCSIVKSDPKYQGIAYVKIDQPCPHLHKSEEGYTCDMYFSDGYPEGCRTFDGREYDFLECLWKKHIPDQKFIIIEKVRK